MACKRRGGDVGALELLQSGHVTVAAKAIGVAEFVACMNVVANVVK